MDIVHMDRIHILQCKYRSIIRSGSNKKDGGDPSHLKMLLSDYSVVIKTLDTTNN